ncbi:uncharacterized protein TEOVI_000695900 [Trypanosoma equiperdum]|uniref:Uncharacterized protein n=1 Tax=Trypanosoma equiperdum TaxID=5694 RepID=A0A1G4I7C7_TRYEQ|nr:hypothetical protein, conserved [Trypanosoma equiperdum]
MTINIFAELEQFKRCKIITHLDPAQDYLLYRTPRTVPTLLGKKVTGDPTPRPCDTSSHTLDGDSVMKWFESSATTFTSRAPSPRQCALPAQKTPLNLIPSCDDDFEATKSVDAGDGLAKTVIYLPMASSDQPTPQLLSPTPAAPELSCSEWFLPGESAECILMSPYSQHLPLTKIASRAAAATRETASPTIVVEHVEVPSTSREEQPPSPDLAVRVERTPRVTETAAKKTPRNCGAGNGITGTTDTLRPPVVATRMTHRRPEACVTPTTVKGNNIPASPVGDDDVVVELVVDEDVPHIHDAKVVQTSAVVTPRVPKPSAISTLKSCGMEASLSVPNGLVPLKVPAVTSRRSLSRKPGAMGGFATASTTPRIPIVTIMGSTRSANAASGRVTSRGTPRTPASSLRRTSRTTEEASGRVVAERVVRWRRLSESGSCLLDSPSSPTASEFFSRRTGITPIIKMTGASSRASPQPSVVPTARSTAVAADGSQNSLEEAPTAQSPSSPAAASDRLSITPTADASLVTPEKWTCPALPTTVERSLVTNKISLRSSVAPTVHSHPVTEKASRCSSVADSTELCPTTARGPHQSIALHSSRSLPMFSEVPANSPNISTACASSPMSNRVPFFLDTEPAAEVPVAVTQTARRRSPIATSEPFPATSEEHSPFSSAPFGSRRRGVIVVSRPPSVAHTAAESTARRSLTSVRSFESCASPQQTVGEAVPSSVLIGLPRQREKTKCCHVM